MGSKTGYTKIQDGCSRHIKKHASIQLELEMKYMLKVGRWAALSTVSIMDKMRRKSALVIRKNVQ